MDHSPRSGPVETTRLRLVGKPKGQRGQVTWPCPHSPGPKRKAPAAGRRDAPALAAGIGCPSRAQGPRLQPGLPRGAEPAPHPAPGPRDRPRGRRRRVPCAGASRARPPRRRQTSPPPSSTFRGALQQPSWLCPQPILLRGLPGAAAPLRGPQGTWPSRPRCRRERSPSASPAAARRKSPKSRASAKPPRLPRGTRILYVSGTRVPRRKDPDEPRRLFRAPRREKAKGKKS